MWKFLLSTYVTFDCGDLDKLSSTLYNEGEEFAGIEKNIDILQNTDLGGKKIGFGCVDTKTERVESPEEISTLIKKGSRNNWRRKHDC